MLKTKKWRKSNKNSLNSTKNIENTENTESKEDGGYGLFIARKLVDVLKIEKKTRGTIFKVEKKLKEAV